MLLHQRIRQIREYRGLKQLAVAQSMQITQQAYSWLETKSDNAKLETLLRYCEIMKIDLPFLMAFGIEINKENMDTVDRMGYVNIFDDYKRLKKQIPAFNDGVLKKAS